MRFDNNMSIVQRLVRKYRILLQHDKKKYFRRENRAELLARKFKYIVPFLFTADLVYLIIEFRHQAR